MQNPSNCPQSEQQQKQRPPRKPSFALWAALITATVLIALAAASVLFPSAPKSADAETGVVEFALRKWDTVEFSVRETPEPTAEPLHLPPDAVDVLIDTSRTALTLSSEAEAKTLLSDYLKACMDGVSEGRALSASFACTIHILPAAGKTPVMTYAEGLAALEADPALVPVRLVRELRTVSVGEIKTETHEEPALEKGKKSYSQLGSGAWILTTSTETTVAGEVQGDAETTETTLFDARTHIVKTGTYTDSDPQEDEPGKKEGPKGKSKGDLALKLPIRTQAESYFGIRGGKMHNGIDLPAKAGTEIKAPGEGIVVYVGERAEYGTVIDIDHGNGFVSRLTHCENVQVEPHQRVFLGDVVATLAPLAYGSGKPHLHYELLIDGIPHNPMYYLD